MKAAPELGPVAMFDAWASMKAKAHRSLSAASAAKYRSIWNTWIAFLAGKNLTWLGARPEHLAAFIASRTPRAGAVSPVTQARYWSVITDVYDKSIAVQLAHGLANPVNPMAGAIPPAGAQREVSHSTTLVPTHLAKLRTFAHTEPAAAGSELDPRTPAWANLRDRTLLAIALETAATNEELALLRTRDVLGLSISERQLLLRPPPGALPGAGADHEPTQDRIDFAAPRGRSARLAVQLNGPRQPQRRTLDLSPESSALLRQWLFDRARLPCPDDTLFVSKKGLRALSSMQIWRTLADATKLALRSHKLKPAHYGSTLIRNAVLLSWLLQGLDVDEVARLAGVGSVSKLERLINYADEQTQERFRAALAASRPKQRDIEDEPEQPTATKARK